MASSTSWSDREFSAGATGSSETAYYAGWRIVGALVAAGWSLAQISHTPEDEMPALVESGLSLLTR